jgi:hypothetical protein
MQRLREPNVRQTQLFAAREHQLYYFNKINQLFLTQWINASAWERVRVIVQSGKRCTETHLVNFNWVQFLFYKNLYPKIWTTTLKVK